MSCPPESAFSFYVDGELSPEALHEVESHLVGCRDCRQLVVSLQAESALFADVLHGRERSSFRRETRPAAAPRTLAMGLVPSVAASVIVLTVLGTIVESIPRGIDWLNPFRAQGVYEMAFDLMFLIRDQAPGLLELVIAAAALAGVAGLLFFAVSLVSRRFTGIAMVGLVAAAVVAAPSPSRALDLRFHEKDFEVPAGTVIDQTVIVNADSVRVDGVIEGDLVVLLAERLVVHGEIKGNLFSSARTIEMSGKVAGNFHAVGETVRIDGDVGGNLYSLAEVVTLTGRGKVARDMSVVASEMTVDGDVGRDLFSLGEWLELRGQVSRNVDVRADRAAILDDAKVGGDVTALFWKDSEIQVAPTAQITGEVSSSIHDDAHGSWRQRYTHPHYYMWLGIRLAAAWIVGVLVFVAMPRFFDASLETTGAFFRSLGLGALTVVAAPLAILVAACTLIGVPLALAGLATFAAALYLSGILIAGLLGQEIVKPAGPAWPAFGLALLVGLAILMVATNVPFVGHVVYVLVALTGLGLIVSRTFAALRAR